MAFPAGSPVMTLFETTGHVLLRVTLGGGEVTVRPGDDGRVEVELVPLRDDDVTRRAIAEARVELTDRRDGHEVAVTLPRQTAFRGRRGARVGVTVRCPRGSDLALRTDSASLDATGPLGAVDVKTASGEVSLEDAASLAVETASGDVRVRDVTRTLDLRTASGDAAIRRCGGPLSAKLVSGNLSVGDAAAGVAVTTVSGDLRVEAAGGGAIRVQSVSGDVELAIKPGQRLYVDASSVSGTMSSELGLDQAPPAGSTEPVRELRVRTVSGDLKIVRAKAAGA